MKSTNKFGNKFEDILTEQDFYPPFDNRMWKSYVKDIGGGDNFANYCKDVFKLLNEEDYFEDCNSQPIKLNSLTNKVIKRMVREKISNEDMTKGLERMR